MVKKNQVDTVSAVKANQLPSSPISKPVYTKFSNHTEKVSKDNIKDTSDSFKMFWFDYAEAENSLLLFGKIMTKEGKLVSGVVKVDGICRELFFLPREYRIVDDEEDKSKKLTAIDVLEEIQPLY